MHGEGERGFVCLCEGRWAAGEAWASENNAKNIFTINCTHTIDQFSQLICQIEIFPLHSCLNSFSMICSMLSSYAQNSASLPSLKLPWHMYDGFCGKVRKGMLVWWKRELYHAAFNCVARIVLFSWGKPCFLFLILPRVDLLDDERELNNENSEGKNSEFFFFSIVHLIF